MISIPGKRYRVIQWATGNTGQDGLREVIRDPRFDLAGVLVYNPDKEGIDAGDLCGEPATGISATTDGERILNLEADCVVYMARTTWSGRTQSGLAEKELTDDIVALTETGKNIATTCTPLIARGRRLSKENLARFEESCGGSGASIFVSGSGPGFLTEAVPLPFLAFARRVDHIDIG